MSKRMDDAVHERITALTDEGDALADANQFTEAIARFRSALAPVPDPKEDWEAATWIYAAIGDVLRAAREGLHFSYDFDAAPPWLVGCAIGGARAARRDDYSPRRSTLAPLCPRRGGLTQC